MMNGTMVCCCNLTMGMCKCEMTKDGVCITCMSGDKACCDMIQACCDCMTRHDEGRLHLLPDDERHARSAAADLSLMDCLPASAATLH